MNVRKLTSMIGKTFTDYELTEDSLTLINPEHYKQGNIECIDAIKAALTPEEYAGFCKGNVLKYIWRENHKGGREDLLKAQSYLTFLLMEQDA